jgi:hypothetical protein
MKSHQEVIQSMLGGSQLPLLKFDLDPFAEGTLGRYHRKSDDLRKDRERKEHR